MPTLAETEYSLLPAQLIAIESRNGAAEEFLTE
jgi:hypothetical protein